MGRVLQFLILALILLWQNCSIESKEVPVSCKNLPESFEGLRLVQISDLHGRTMGKDHERLLNRIRQGKPHLICITGDLFEDEEEWNVAKSLLPQLCTLAPTYYVTGNHEWQTPNLKEKLRQMEAMGIVVLANSYEVFHSEGEKMVIAGVHDPCGPFDQKSPQQLMDEIRQKEGKDSFVLMLAHRNDQLSMWSELGADLVLSGHCHGGVVRLPFVGGIFGPGRELFPEYDSGLYTEGDTNLYVSRGLGYSRVKMRVLNRPHLPILLLKGK